MLADIAWGLYGFSRSYTTLLIVVFFAAMALAVYGSLRLLIERLRRPLELQPLDDAHAVSRKDLETFTDEWWKTVPRETRETRAEMHAELRAEMMRRENES